MSESGADSAGQDRGVGAPDSGRLLVRHREGDKQAFAELVSIFRSLIYSYLVRCGVNSADRDDLFQDVFLSVHRSAAKYDSLLDLKPWIFTIVANTVRDYFRNQKVRRLVPVDHSKPEITSHDSHSDSEANETAVWLEKAIALLPLQQREVFVMCSLKLFDQAAVADTLKIPVNTVKTHLSRARASLARSLAARNASLKWEVER